MDKLYNILNDRGYQPVYNKYDKVINVFRIKIYKPKARKYILLYDDGEVVHNIQLSRQSSVIDFVSNYPIVQSRGQVIQ